MNDTLYLLFLSFVGSVLALIGGLIFLCASKLSDILQRYSVPFAAGVLITVSLLAILPEAVHQKGEFAFFVMFVAFFGAYLFERFLTNIHHHNEGFHGKANQSSAVLVVLGDTIHNFIDGITIAVSFMVSPGLGLITAISTFLHEVPHEISDFGILLKAGWKKIHVFAVNIISSLFTIIGAFLMYYLSPEQEFVGAMLAVSAGIFLYLGAVDFLPEVQVNVVNSKLRTLAPMLLGVGLMLAVIAAVPHSHDMDNGYGHHLESISHHEEEDSHGESF